MRTLSSILETSAATALTRPPLLWISAAAASAWGRLLAAMSTRAPRPAKTRAMPFPIPLLAPVTMTERPSIDVSTCDPGGFQNWLSNSRDSNTHCSFGSRLRSGATRRGHDLLTTNYFLLTSLQAQCDTMGTNDLARCTTDGAVPFPHAPGAFSCWSGCVPLLEDLSLAGNSVCRDRRPEFVLCARCADGAGAGHISRVSR